MKTEATYPERPYSYTHEARYISGFKRKLVPYGAQCQECESRKTFLDGGAPRCRKHLTPVCNHGYEVCMSCGPTKPGVIVRKIKG